jgi:hypothetical protein
MAYDLSSFDQAWITKLNSNSSQQRLASSHKHCISPPL